MLLCPVRQCHKPLLLSGKQRRCESGHSFDIARSGYLNLLQPQERRSRQPGDSSQAVAARRRLNDRGFTRPILATVAQVVALEADEEVLDAGCGEGFYLASLAAGSGCRAHGVDISLPAIDAAARRYPECEWIVANADRFLPYSDHSFSAVLSITARLNHTEFYRVLRPDGRLLLALSAPDDLIELRGPGRNRVPRTLAEFVPYFRLRHTQRVTIHVDLDREAVQDVLLSVYRPRLSTNSELQLSTTGGLTTFSLDLLLFEPARDSVPVYLHQSA